MNLSAKPFDALATRFGGSGAYGIASSVVLLSLACPVTAWSGDVSPIIAWGLTFIPGAAVLLVASSFQDARKAVSFVMFSMIFRLAIAGLGGLTVVHYMPSISREVFLLWLGVMYLAALACEVYLTLAMTNAWTLARSPRRDVPASSPALETER